MTLHRRPSVIVHEEEAEDQALLNDDLRQSTCLAHRGSPPGQQMRKNRRKAQWKAKIIRALALLCACSLSVGSHYATYVLGPLKSRLSREMGTSNTEFGLLLAALSLSGTWTPLVGGIMTARLGTAVSSIIATGTVFLGQSLLLIGHLNNEVWLMTLGMLIFGLGRSPLAVAQETIIVRFFRSHGLGVSLALGLVAGKGASFISARTSYPLSQWSPNAPFYFSAGAAGFSFVINLAYIFISNWLVNGADIDGPELSVEAVAMTEAQVVQQVADKKKFRMREVFRLGDVVWAYIALNVLCGMIWHPFIHLAPNMFEHRFGLSELDASSSAAYLLSGSMLLYPICGTIVDKAKRGSVVFQLMAVASVLTLLAFFWMILPPTRTLTPWPAIICFGTGMGFAPLLLVVIVPRIVSLEYVSTTLGLHKSLENTGGTITQTLSGLWLDFGVQQGKSGSHEIPLGVEPRLQWLLNGFLFVNLLHLVAIWGLGYLNDKKQGTLRQEVGQRGDDDQDEGCRDTLNFGNERALDHTGSPLLRPDNDSLVYQSYGTYPRCRRSIQDSAIIGQTSAIAEEVKRGKLFASLSAGMVVLAWVLFLATSFIKIRSKRERERVGHSPD